MNNPKTLLSGRATPEATRAYSIRMWHNNPRISPNSWRVLEGLTLGKIGVGSYRLSGTPAHLAAFTLALTQGCNVVDTASNYTDGQSEEAIGRTLTYLVQNGILQREELVVVTKGGYIQGALYQKLQRNRPPAVVEVDDGLWHCLHPSFIRTQVEASRQRLGLETLDVYLLHNPEYFLIAAAASGANTEAARTTYYQCLTEAFVALEDLCQQGYIGCYGVSSNTFVVPQNDPTFTNLNRVYEAAEAAALQHYGRKKRPLFRVIELPMNLVELGAVHEANHVLKTLSFASEEAASVLDVAVARHLSVLVNRPLNAFVDGHPLRLADPASAVNAADALNALALVEHKIETTLPIWPTTTAGHPLLRLSGAADTITHHLNSVIAYDSVLGNLLLPQAAAMTQRLHEAHQEALATLYTEVVQRFCAALKYQGQLKDAENAIPLKAALASRLPQSWQGAPLQQIALNAVASTPGVTTVLCGLRDEAYVADALATFERGDFPDAAALLGSNPHI